jgi:hypothetical protein
VINLGGTFFQIKLTINKTPITTALSAILKVGQDKIEIQSTTGPCRPPGSRNIRSDRFPKMPPKTKPKPSDHLRESILEAKNRIAAAADIEKTERNMVALVARLKAAPVLKTSCNFRKLPKISIGSSIKIFTAAIFVK